MINYKIYDSKKFQNRVDNTIEKLIESDVYNTTSPYNFTFVDIIGNKCKLNDKQQEIVYDTSKFKIIQGVRQSGKSFILECIALKEAFQNSNTTILITSYTVQSAELILKHIRDLYYNITPENKPGIEILTKKLIVFDNGSEIHVGSTAENAGRGFGVDILLMDELAYCNETKLQSYWDSMFPTVICRHPGKVVIASTRKSRSKNNLFWKLWISAVDKKKGVFKPFTINSKDMGRTKETAKELKSILGRAKYDREYTIRTK
jgi:hypothetical protein